MTAVYMGRLLRQIDQSDDPAWYEAFINTLVVDISDGWEIGMSVLCDDSGKVCIDWALAQFGDAKDFGTVSFQSSGDLATDVQRFRAAVAPVYAQCGVGQ
jgi:hypothetical protein